MFSSTSRFLARSSKRFFSELTNMEGSRVPSVVFHTRQQGEWVDVKSDDIFAKKTVICFGLPGAFTPTCSSTHLPRYEELYEDFIREGVDDICCVSVNDSFVMNAWAKSLGIQKVKMIPDGNGEFTKDMSMLVDKSNLGFGSRSWRYSMVVFDGNIQKMFVEPKVEGDPFEVSDADTLLKFVNPAAKAAV